MWNLKYIDTDKALYIAIAEALERDIKLGVLKPGDRLPTHRALAETVGVTITTATRAYAEAEKRGLIHSVVGNGTFVTSDAGQKPYRAGADIEEKHPIEMGILNPLYCVEPDFTDAMTNLLSDEALGEALKQYGPPQGLLHHRQTGAEWIRRFGVDTDAERVVVTAGSQHALNCIFSALFDKEDYIASDCLTYPGLKTAAKRNDIRVEPVMMDEQGMLPDELSKLCRRLKIKGVYTTGTIQNPANYKMGSERRKALLDVISAHDLLLIEDDMYSFLADNFEENLSSSMPENSVYIAGLSKIFLMGLRAAFVSVPRHGVEAVAESIVDNMWIVPVLNVEAACRIINSGLADESIDRKRKELEWRCRVFNEKMEGFQFSLRERSMFAWLKLPEPLKSGEFVMTAAERGVHIYSSQRFVIGHMPSPQFVRLSLSSPESRELYVKGLDIIKDLLTEAQY